jgi:hypothetical protein
MKRESTLICSRSAARIAAAGILGMAVVNGPAALGDNLPMVANAAPAQTISSLPPDYVSPGHPSYFYRPDYVDSFTPHRDLVGGGIGVGAAAANAGNGHGAGPGGPGSPGR